MENRARAPDFNFYQTIFMGDAIPTEAEFRGLARDAAVELARYKRIYTVRAPDETAEDMAVCAMAEALYGFQQAVSSTGAVSSVSVGSVSTSYKAAEIDTSAKAQSAELYRRACLYLDIYRGV